MKLGSILMDSYVSKSFVESSKLVVNTPGLLESMLEFTHESNQVEAKREMYKNLLENIRMEEGAQSINENGLLVGIIASIIAMIGAFILSVKGKSDGSGGGTSVSASNHTGVTDTDADRMQQQLTLAAARIKNISRKYDMTKYVDEMTKFSAQFSKSPLNCDDFYKRSEAIFKVCDGIVAESDIDEKDIFDASEISIEALGDKSIEVHYSIGVVSVLNDAIQLVNDSMIEFSNNVRQKTSLSQETIEKSRQAEEMIDRVKTMLKNSSDEMETETFDGLKDCLTRFGRDPKSKYDLSKLNSIYIEVLRSYDNIVKNLANITKSLNNIKSSTSSMDEQEQAPYLKSIKYHEARLIQFLSIATTYKDRFYSIYKSEYTAILKTLNAYIAAIRSIETEESEDAKGVDESALINESDVFFNDMEYMISEARCEQQDSIDKAYINAMLRETNCLASASSYLDTIQEFNTIHENLGVKIKTTYNNVMAKIKEVFAQFMEKLRGNFTSTKNYMDKYKKTITGSNFVKRQYNTRDIIGGIDRVMNTEVPYLDYSQLQNDLNTIPDFMKSKFAEMKVANKPFEGASASDVAAFAKDFFNGPEMKLDTTEFQKNINKIYDFLYNIKKIENSINKSIGNIDKVVKSILKTAGADYQAPADAPVAGTDATGTGTAGSGTTPTQPTEKQESSVYSYLYGKNIFTEAEDVTEPATGTNTASGTTTSKTAANNITSGDGVDNQAQRNNDKPIVETHAQVYMDVCTAILRAKLTSLEFIRAECMQIIRAHVADYVGKTGSPDGAVSPAQQQQQQAPAEQPADNGSGKLATAKAKVKSFIHRSNKI